MSPELITPGTNEAARTARLVGWQPILVRQGVKVLAAVLLGLNLGLATGVAWFAVAAAADLWMSYSVHRGVRSRLDRAHQLASVLVSGGVWSWGATLYWQTGDPGLRIMAVCLLATQMILAQVFVLRSWMGALVFSLPAALALLVLPTLFGGFGGLTLTTICFGVATMIGYVAKVAFDNVRLAQVLVKTQDALRQQTAAAVAASQAKSEFLAMMSHEIRTPMTGVLGMAHVLGQSDLNPAQAGQVEMLLRSGEGLMTILNDILDMSKIEAGKLELEVRPFDLQDAASRVCDLWREAANGKDVALRLVWDPDMARCFQGDPTRVRQIMLNLVSNAIKFTCKGQVTLSLSQSDGKVVISVADTGPGMTPEEQARLFQPFSQADATITRRFGGTGLGLTICRRLVEMMGGQIGVTSAVGSGSVFQVRLPLTAAEPEEELVQAPLSTGLDGLRVLVVDDNRVNQAVVRAVLEAVGATVDTADDGEAGLGAMHAVSFDVVLMDIHMPIMDGVSALDVIRRTPELSPTPVIALTADVMPTEIQRLEAAGFDGVQPKPLQTVDLIAEIVRLSRPALAA